MTTTGKVTNSRHRVFSNARCRAEDAERIVLGGILLTPDLMAQTATVLKPEDFYSPLHRRVYEAMTELFNTSKPLDPVFIFDILNKGDLGRSLGGVSTISNLTYGIPHFGKLTDIDNYINLVKEKARIRKLISICGFLSDMALDPEISIEELFDKAESSIFTVTQDETAKGPVPVKELAEESLTEIGNLRKSIQPVEGVLTGLRDVDNILGGLEKKDLIILAARPSMGKTAMALQWAMTAVQQDLVGIFFSLEMSAKQCIARMLCMQAGISVYGYMHNRLMDSHWQAAVDAYQPIAAKNLYIDDTPAISPTQLLAKARRIKQKHKRIDIIVVDYLQLMQISGIKERRQEIDEISRGLKRIAKELDCPVVALSQLSRSPENRNPPRPMMSDLRDSGAIEQDADVVCFIYRPAYYESQRTDTNQNLAEVIVAKHRNGPTGTAETVWRREVATFSDIHR